MVLLLWPLTAVPRHRVDRCGGGDWRLLVLPGGEELQDHGVVQEHGTAARRGGARGRDIERDG